MDARIQAARSSSLSAPSSKAEPRARQGRFARGFERLFPNSTLKKKIEEKRLEKLASVLDLSLSGPNRGHRRTAAPQTGAAPSPSYEKRVRRLIGQTQNLYRKQQPFSQPDQDNQACASFISGVLELKKQLRGFQKALQERTLPSDAVAKIRRSMCALMESPVYLALIDCDHPAVNFLQFLSVKLHAADGQEILKEHARAHLAPTPRGRHISMGDLADSIGGTLAASNHYKNNNVFQGTVWSLRHPRTFFDNLMANRDPLNRYPAEANPSHLGPVFSRPATGGATKTLRSYYAPAITGDRIAEYGLLPAYKKLGTFEVYFNYMDSEKKDEKKRIDDIERIATKKGYEGCIKHVLIGFDTKFKHSATRNLLKNYTGPNDFIDRYKAFLLPGVRDIGAPSGFYIPKDLLSDRQIDGIFETAKAFFNSQFPNGIVPPDKKRQVGQAILLAIDAIAAAAILYRSFDDPRVRTTNHEGLDPDLTSCYISARCKQHIDRGAVQSNAFRLFYRLFEDDSPLTEDEFHEISGGILGRARTVDDRDILFRRYEFFDSLMRTIGPDHALLAAHLRSYRDRFLIADC